jgi:iron-sulfur cluster repair protein YtfE (RIC family)/uncharacterized protein (DUF2249 family)
MAELITRLDESHRACEKLANDAQDALERSDWRGFADAVALLREALLAHFSYEEEELFPEFERASGMCEFTSELRRQHGEMRAILDALASASPRHDPEGCASEFMTLALFLRQHMAREEQTMYPAFARVLGSAPARSGRNHDLAAAMDLRGLEPPQPIVRIFEALERSPGTPLRAVLPHEPVPLYRLLRERGFKYQGAYRADGGFEVLIEKDGRARSA